MQCPPLVGTGRPPATACQHPPLQPHFRNLMARFLLAWLLPVLYGCAVAAPCPQPGRWLAPAPQARTLSQPDLMRNLADRRVVLLGEEHDDAQHHAWQLHTLAALHASRPDMVIGFEGFPRRVQPVLRRWMDGQLSEADFLRELRWDEIWGMDARLYLPIFHFARMHGIELIALNVERALVNRASREGWAAIPANEREGVSDPAPAPEAYLHRLLPAYAAHAHAQPGSDIDDPAFRRFVDGMLLWDRAMAQALAEALRQGPPERLLVGIVGRGHAEYFDGIPRQLRDLGVADSAVLLPWDLDRDCRAPPEGIADAVFGLQAKAMQSSGPRLGVELAPADGGARVHRVLEDSVAAAAGLRSGDVIRQAAGSDVRGVQGVITTVRRQSPGTWLPLRVLRDGQEIDVLAKFPAAP